jgi:small conductance mechanosensitive channel
MKVRSLTRVLPVLLAVGLLAAPGSLRAQEEGGGEPGLLLDSRELLEDIADERAEIAELRKQKEGLEGEEAVLMDRRLMRKGLQVLSAVDTLVANVVALETEGVEADEIRKPTEDLLGTISSLVHPRLEGLRDQLAELSAMKAEETGDELIQLEARQSDLNETVNIVLQAGLDNLEHMQALGLDTKKEKKFLGDQLTERAATEMERVSLTLDRIALIQERLADTPEDAELKLRLTQAESQRETTTGNLTAAVRMMNELGLDTAEHKQFLIETTGELTTDILDTDVALSLFQQWARRAREWAAESGPGLTFKSFLVILVFFAFFLVSRVVRRITERAVSSPKVKLSQLVRKMIVAASGNVVLFLGLLVALSQLGFSLGPVLATLGIAGFVLGFALQEVLGNFAAGVMILIYRPFDVGDMIEAAGVFGTVHAMSMVSTSIMTIDNQTLIVPNGKIWGDVIKNVTGQKNRRIDMVFGVSYSDDIPHTEKVLETILGEHPKVLDDPEPMVRLHTLGESSVDFIVRPWVRTEDYWDVYWDITREVKMRFDREGISIPFPQRDIHYYEERRLTPGSGGSGDKQGGRAT